MVIENGCHGAAIFGSTGQAQLIPIAEKINLLNTSDKYWMGTKICQKKHLKSPDWLRGLKPKIYPWWRLDKERSIQIINNGGWHFSFLYNPASSILDSSFVSSCFKSPYIFRCF